jgi:hypothetical protein
MNKLFAQTAKEAENIAAREGLTAFFARDNELFLDFDQPFPGRVLLILLEQDLIQSELRTVSRNGNTHVYLRLNRFVSLFERLALQAVLQSDPVKEILTTLRALDGEGVIALFETSIEAIRVARWRLKWTVENLSQPPERPERRKILLDGDEV